MEKNVLIVVDMQNDFVTGSLGTKEAVGIVENVKEKVEECSKNGWYIVATQDTHTDKYLSTNEGRNLPIEHCIRGTKGWNIVEGINANHIVLKNGFGYSDWKKDVFESYEIKPKSIMLIGLCTDICVVTNALMLRALYPELDILVDASCCAGVTPQSHNAALEVMKMCQIKILNNF